MNNDELERQLEGEGDTEFYTFFVRKEKNEEFDNLLSKYNIHKDVVKMIVTNCGGLFYYELDIKHRADYAFIKTILEEKFKYYLLSA